MSTLGWRWWLRVGINETPRMRVGCRSWPVVYAEYRAALSASYGRLQVSIGANLIPALTAMADAARKAAAAMTAAREAGSVG